MGLQMYVSITHLWVLSFKFAFQMFHSQVQLFYFRRKTLWEFRLQDEKKIISF